MELVNTIPYALDTANRAALMDDGSRVSWEGWALTCTCTTAKRCPSVQKQMCQHIIQILRDRVDEVWLPKGQMANMRLLWICVFLPGTLGQAPSWVEVNVGPSCCVYVDGLRENPRGLEPLFILSGGESRGDVRDSLIPFLVDEALHGDKQCVECGTPLSITELRQMKSAPTREVLYAATRDMVSLLSQNHRCRKHDISDLIPPSF